MVEFTNLDGDNSDFSDIDDDSHKKLIKNVLNISGKPAVLHPTRTEPSLKISEFDVVRHTNKNVHLGDLANVLQRKSQQHVNKQIKRLAQKTLAKQLEKPQADRIHRSVTYKKAQLELDKWDPIVASMRSSSTTQFPLHSDAKIKEKDLDKADWGYKNDLQKELQLLEPKEEIYVMTDEGEFALTAEEIAEKRREAAKMRAHESYKIAKARRQNKIKSKKYHRIQKKAKIKQQLKEFELLQKTNPEAALEKLEEIERARAEERMSLRHKSTGQWAKSKLIRAKYDRETRKTLAQQLAISRDLTQKLKNTEDSDSETDLPKSEELIRSNFDNPWVNDNIKVSKEVGDFLGAYRKYWENQQGVEGSDIEQTQESKHSSVEESNEKRIPTKKKSVQTNNEGYRIQENIALGSKTRKQKKRCVSTSEWEVTDTVSVNTNVENELNKIDSKMLTKITKKYQKIKKELSAKSKRTNTNSSEPEHLNRLDMLSLPKQNVRPIIDEALDETAHRKKKNLEDHTFISDVAISSIKNKTNATNNDEISPDKFVKLSTTLNTAIPDLMELEDNEEEVNNDEVISEAFQNDDVIDNFHQEKLDEIKANQPKDIDLSMAGWGSWGGKDIQVSKKKKKRFIVKFPKKMPRKDSNRGDLIINESGNNKARTHLVSEVPFPFKNVKDFEASIRAPIGSTFVPETAVKRLTQPAVVTKLGTIIEPMSKDVLVQKKK